MEKIKSFSEELNEKYGSHQDGEIINNCFRCKQPKQIYKLVKPNPSLYQEFEPFIAPCTVSCLCPDPVSEKKLSFSQANIPIRYQNAETSFVPKKLSCYIYGPTRVGKTTVACALGIQQMKKGKSVFFTTMSGISDHEFGDKDHGLAFKNNMLNVNLLIIDDLGKKETSEWSVSLLFDVINERYNSMKDIIITSNYSPTVLGKELARKGAPTTADAITRRITDMCDPVMFGQRKLGE